MSTNSSEDSYAKEPVREFTGVFERWALVEDKRDAGVWRVEGISYNGEDCYVTLFSGPEARDRAEEYFEFLLRTKG